MLRIKAYRMKDLEKFGFIDLGKNAYMKDAQPTIRSSNWVLRVDKHTREIKCWNFANGMIGATRKFIQDLIKADMVEKEYKNDI